MKTLDSLLTRRGLLSVIGGAAVLSHASRSRAQSPGTQLLVVGWDGAERRVVREMLRSGALPHLAALGWWGPVEVTTPDGEVTQTKPGWAKIHTGRAAAETGVFDNDRWLVIPRGLSLLERYRMGGAHALWAVAKTHTMALDPTQGHVPGPLYHAAMAAEVRIELPHGTVDLAAVPWLLAWRQEPAFAFIHSDQPDYTGHAESWESDAYRDQLRTLDTQLGVYRAAWPSAVIAVLTDHGFGCPDAYHHRCSSKGWVAATRPVPSALTLTQVGAWLQGLQ